MPEKDKSIRAVHKDGRLIPLNPSDLAHFVDGQEVLIEITRETGNAEAEPSDESSVDSDRGDEEAE